MARLKKFCLWMAMALSIWVAITTAFAVVVGPWMTGVVVIGRELGAPWLSLAVPLVIAVITIGFGVWKMTGEQ